MLAGQKMQFENVTLVSENVEVDYFQFFLFTFNILTNRWFTEKLKESLVALETTFNLHITEL